MNALLLFGCKRLRNAYYLWLVAWGCVFWVVRGSLQTLAAETWDTFKVVAQFPHDPAAFTQGFVIHEGRLLESTGLYGGGSSLREIDRDTGRLLRAFYLPSDFFTEGLAVGGGRLVQLTWKQGIARVYDLNTWEPLPSFAYQGEGWGLTHDSRRFIMSDGSHMLTFRDSGTFAMLGEVSVHDSQGPVKRLNELEWIQGECWANQWLSDRIARIDVDTGQVLSWIDIEGLFDWRSLKDGDAVANGIAYDTVSNRIFLTGKRWPWIFEVQIAPRGHVDIPRLSCVMTQDDQLEISFPTFKGNRYRIERVKDLRSLDQAISLESLLGDGHPVRRRYRQDQATSLFFRVLSLP
ncbi:MAG: glutaminyl-peptide cyclotransferase [Verrucomicrobiales bacterium]